MPNIRVDDDVYSFLKERAEAFVDSPNSVLRRLLGIDGLTIHPTTDKPRVVPYPARSPKRARVKKKGSRAPRGSLLSEDAYVIPILSTLAALGRSRAASDVLDGVGKQLESQLTALDRETLPSGQIRWRNRAQFVRLRLVEEGLLARDSPRGVWALTDAGLAAAQAGVR